MKYDTDELTQLRADLARVTAERDELKKSRDADAWANQQLTLVLINAGAPEFSSASHALEWATETATLCASVAELEELANSWCDRAQQLQQRNAELESWKKSASEIMTKCEFQAVGTALGLRLGADVAPEILPSIKALQQRVADREADIAEVERVWGHQITDFLAALAEGRAMDRALGKSTPPTTEKSSAVQPAPNADTVTIHRQTFFDKARNREMCLESGGEWDGWLFYKHPDGQWISLRKATEADRAAIDAART